MTSLAGELTEIMSPLALTVIQISTQGRLCHLANRENTLRHICIRSLQSLHWVELTDFIMR